uniref:Uncharacterized protein n=1 Tax=Pristionchus pacificus TaxID=54126 RepID=A0A2A6BSV6_PRIPA|eukprot:PDM69052.1 hypothetical protein PRIPAC_47354 [Pristionchus pacificus]
MAKNAMLSVDSVKRKNVYFVDDLPSHTADLETTLHKKISIFFSMFSVQMDSEKTQKEINLAPSRCERARKPTW